MRDGPGVNPGDATGLVDALGEDDGAESGDAVGNEAEAAAGVVLAGEEAHQELVRRRAVEPPLEVRGEKPVDGGGVAAAQGFIEGGHHPFVEGFFQWGFLN